MHKTEGLLSDTCYIHLGNLRTFLKYPGSQSIEYQYLETEAMGIPLMKTEKKQITGLTKPAINTIMAELDLSSKTGKRNLFFMIAYDTATGISEILSIQIKDITLDLKKPSITIADKGNKMRILCFLSKAVTHIRRNISVAHGSTPDP